MTTSGAIPIERVDEITPDELDRDHLRRPRPVVIRRALRTARDGPAFGEEAPWCETLAELDIVTRNGSAAELVLSGGESGEATIPSTFGAFHDRLVAEPSLTDVCAEHRAHPELARLLTGWPYTGDGGPDDSVSQIFLGGPAARAHLHYDGDLRGVLMTQVFGRKRYILVDPIESAKLLAITDPALQRTSGVFLEHMDAGSLDAFLDYVGGCECVLEPGETLVMPAGWWHYVEYLEVAFSVSLRLGRNRYLRFLADEVPVRSVEWLALAQRYVDESSVSPAALAAFETLEAAVAASSGDHESREAALERLCLRLCGALGLAPAGLPVTAEDLRRRARLVTASRDDGGDAGTAPSRARTTTARFVDGSRVSLVDGARLVAPLAGEGLVLVVGDRLVSSLPPDRDHPWTLGLLARVERRPNITVDELVEQTGAAPPVVAAFLAELSAAGWVREVPPDLDGP